ncbi:fumarylacetoacetate hydrolase family protein [Lacimicrobium sp. SS2-24]|uniref:fumarylacetoacetate hydrolase family protein n=1 Tax=Lacimicrobium sp. SS2-24 TaxID=2005569 RepID=UPI001AEF9995|nr:fumarylacetoacetate hydrolase family protein [Lacimicrobium sp. SS2-24]
MSHYALTRYLKNDKPKTAMVIGHYRYDLADLYEAANPTQEIPDWARDSNQCIAAWPQLSSQLNELATKAASLASQEKIIPLADNIKLTTPFTPTTIFGTASNYHEHAEEMQTVLAAKEDSSPYVFMKATSSVIATDEDVVMPPETSQLDWEVELGVVIGKPARRVKAENALDYIAGYTVVNDISARDLNRRSDYPFKHDWFRGKSWDTFCPMGPVFVPKQAIADPHKVKLGLWLNGKQMQNGNTSELIWNIFEQIEYLSGILTLRPGDLIMTGTPAGVGKGMGLFLKAGDKLEASAEGVGCIVNTVRAEAV